MPKKKEVFSKPFRTGDVVTYISAGRSWKKGEEHIIGDVDIDGVNDYSYSTNRGAWFTHTDFKLVRECDEASISQFLKDKQDEEESYSEVL